ncbi:MAG: SDR family NAD(P)-dependent oxidoreductase [Candidatus Accumulibacter sp.]|jgi:NAD(P)-dependent dehydrogenase (short-subunit alcohol dehydrogenase family)|nr:SDR family NAD(P)-dependent oxidoreductase [Accumulibacter sp.]
MANDGKAGGADRVWFITGCSTGFGRDLARQVLESGDRVAVTARKPEVLAEFAASAASGRALVLKLDVTDPAQVDAAVAAAQERFGRIDVLVNNAGIGYFAAVEESEEKEVRRMFEVNVFALGRMTQAVLPGMRARRRGFIVNISSLGGINSSPALGYYSATKFAVEGLSGSLAVEVEPLGIKVIVVEPSGFRTDWAGRSANESPVRIEDYAATAGVKREQLRSQSGKQPGDPLRAARAIVEAVRSPNPPRHLPLGNAAYDIGTARLESLLAEFRAGEAVARAADSPKN